MHAVAPQRPGQECLCRARKTALQGTGKPEAHRRSHPGGRASGNGGSHAGGGVRPGLGLGGAVAGEALPARGTSPALTHGLLRNTYDANGSSSPGASCPLPLVSGSRVEAPSEWTSLHGVQ